MSEVQPGITQARYSRKIVHSVNGEPHGGKAYFVLVSHKELDSLIGQLMQMCDLTGDQEQRKALKDTIKQINRDWLDNLYEASGYDRWSGLKEDVANVIED